MVLHEGERMFDYEFSRFDSGLLFYYVSSTDQRQHMFWRFLDEGHPQYDAKLAARFGGTIEGIYRECDRFLDGVLRRIDPETIVIVMSDHGFATFRRQFNLNTWLFENGYHRLRNPFQLEKSGLLREHRLVEDAGLRRRAQRALHQPEGPRSPGHRRSRGRRGEPHPRDRGKLEQTVDPKTGERAILRAFVSRDSYRGSGIGERPGHRLRVQSRLPHLLGVARSGKFSKNVFEDNNEKWSGDHMGAPELLPGIVAANRPVRAASPALFDLTATILAIYGIAKPPDMIGESIF